MGGAGLGMAGFELTGSPWGFGAGAAAGILAYLTS
jgi:hypothetical protein